MTTPTPRLLWLLALGLVAAALPAVVTPNLWPVWLVLTVALLTLAGIEAVLLGSRRPVMTVELPAAIGLRSGGELAVILRSGGRRALPPCEVHCDADPLLRRLRVSEPRIGDEGEVRVAVHLQPLRRGEASPGPIWLRWTGPLGLMRRTEQEPIEGTIAILPELAVSADNALRALSAGQRLGQFVERFTGEGSEFHQLRDYVPGLDHRRLDWKASARHHRLLCRQLRAERDQQVILAVDCGRLMGVVDAGIPKLDHAVDATLRLALLSLRSGDRVGLYSFAAGPHRWLPPRGGLARFKDIQHAAARFDYTSEETNFTLALAELSRRLTRRALVVVLTDFVDAITADLMRDNLRRLSRRHLVVCVALRDASLDRVAATTPSSAARVARAVIAEDFRQERRTVMQTLKRLGVLTLDVAPAELSTALLNRYLEIKRREMIA